MNTLRIAVVAALLIGLMVGPAAALKLEDAPGYVDLEWIEIPDTADEIQDIDLSPVLLDMARDAEQAGDSSLAKALGMVHSIRVKSWSLDGDGDPDTEQAVKRITDRLRSDGWKRLIYVKDDDEIIAVSTFYDGEDMAGLMLVAYEPGDSVTFVNVVGDLDLGTLFKLASEIDSDNLEELLEEYDGKYGIESDDDDE
ncbi:hypothetical protein DRQ50_02230 [bacterium]|nr:MAG: hypothetical protein DRQ50_02230 [bacterium]